MRPENQIWRLFLPVLANKGQHSGFTNETLKRVTVVHVWI